MASSLLLPKELPPSQEDLSFQAPAQARNGTQIAGAVRRRFGAALAEMKHVCVCVCVCVVFWFVLCFGLFCLCVCLLFVCLSVCCEGSPCLVGFKGNLKEHQPCVWWQKPTQRPTLSPPIHKQRVPFWCGVTLEGILRLRTKDWFSQEAP